MNFHERLKILVQEFLLENCVAFWLEISKNKEKGLKIRDFLDTYGILKGMKFCHEELEFHFFLGQKGMNFMNFSVDFLFWWEKSSRCCFSIFHSKNQRIKAAAFELVQLTNL